MNQETGNTMLLEEIRVALSGTAHLQAFAERYPILAQDFIPVAKEVLENEEHIIRWIQQPLLGLGDQRPIDLLGKGEIAPVVDELLRMEYGVHSFI